MELQLETEQQIHFRSVIKLSELQGPTNQMEDGDNVSTAPDQSESSSSKYSSALLSVRVMLPPCFLLRSEAHIASVAIS